MVAQDLLQYVRAHLRFCIVFLFSWILTLALISFSRDFLWGLNIFLRNRYFVGLNSFIFFKDVASIQLLAILHIQIIIFPLHSSFSTFFSMWWWSAWCWWGGERWTWTALNDLTLHLQRFRTTFFFVDSSILFWYWFDCSSSHGFFYNIFL